MSKEIPVTVSMSSPHGLARGMWMFVGGKLHRIVDVPTATTVVIDRPWWTPIARFWIAERRVYEWVAERARRFWFRFRFGWDDPDDD